MRAVNLLPRELGSGRTGFDRVLAIGLAVTLVVVLATIAGFSVEKSSASTEQQRLAAAQAALAKAQNQNQPTKAPTAHLQIPVVLSQQEPWHVALDAALSSRVAWDVLLRQLEYVVPNRVTLTSVTLGSASATANGSITLGGTAFSETDIASFLSTLARVPNVTQVTLISSAATVGTNVTAFQISAQLTLPAAATATTTTTTTTTTGG